MEGCLKSGRVPDTGRIRGENTSGAFVAYELETELKSDQEMGYRRRYTLMKVIFRIRYR